MKNSLALFFGLVVLIGCGEPISQPKTMLNEKLKCPEGSVSYIDRHGGLGANQWVHSCKKNDGPYHVWRNEVLIIEGQFDEGKEVGTWIYRDKEGNVIKTINYDEKST